MRSPKAPVRPPARGPADKGGGSDRQETQSNLQVPCVKGEKPGKDDFHGRAKPNKGDPFAGMVGMLLVHGRFLSSAKGFFPFHGKAQEVRNQAGGEVSRRASDIVKRRATSVMTIPLRSLDEPMASRISTASS